MAISRLPRPRTFAASWGQPLPRPPTPRVGRRRGHLRSAACVHRRVPTPAAFPLSRPGPRTRGRAPATRHRREGRTRARPRARRVDLQVPAHARARPWRERTPCVGAATEGERRRCGRRRRGTRPVRRSVHRALLSKSSHDFVSRTARSSARNAPFAARRFATTSWRGPSRTARRSITRSIVFRAASRRRSSSWVGEAGAWRNQSPYTWSASWSATAAASSSSRTSARSPIVRSCARPRRWCQTPEPMATTATTVGPAARITSVVVLTLA